jgi:hypothetical protein
MSRYAFKCFVLLFFISIAGALLVLGCDGEETIGGTEPIKLEDDSHYIGELKDGVPHGIGMMIWPDGSFYKGEWQFGSQHGKGIWANMDCEVYEGDYINNERHGNGIWTKMDGESFHGEWQANNTHDIGISTQPEGFQSVRIDDQNQYLSSYYILPSGLREFAMGLSWIEFDAGRSEF